MCIENYRNPSWGSATIVITVGGALRSCLLPSCPALWRRSLGCKGGLKDGWKIPELSREWMGCWGNGMMTLLVMTGIIPENSLSVKRTSKMIVWEKKRSVDRSFFNKLCLIPGYPSKKRWGWLMYRRENTCCFEHGWWIWVQILTWKCDRLNLLNTQERHCDNLGCCHDAPNDSSGFVVEAMWPEKLDHSLGRWNCGHHEIDKQHVPTGVWDVFHECFAISN